MVILLPPSFGTTVELCLGSVGDEVVFGVLFIFAVHLGFEAELIDYVVGVLIRLVVQESQFYAALVSW